MASNPRVKLPSFAPALTFSVGIYLFLFDGVNENVLKLEEYPISNDCGSHEEWHYHHYPHWQTVVLQNHWLAALIFDNVEH